MRRVWPIAFAIASLCLVGAPLAGANHSTIVHLQGGTTISQDGSRVFAYTSAPLLPEDTDGKYDLYEVDEGGDTPQLASTGRPAATALIRCGFQFGRPDWSGNTWSPRWPMSSDGTRVFFLTHEALVSEDTDSCAIFSQPPGCLDWYERSGGITRLVSTSTSARMQPSASSKPRMHGP